MMGGGAKTEIVYPVKAPAWLAACDKALVLVLRTICVVCFAVLLALLAGNVFVRFFPVAAFFWFDEIVEWAFAWMIFIGAAALWARDEHFRLEWINEKIRGTSTGHLVAAGIECLSLVFIAIFFYQSWQLTMLARDWTPVFNLPRRCLYVCMPVSALIMVVYSVRNVTREVLAFLFQVRNPDAGTGERGGGLKD